MGVVAAFLRRDFRINISYRVSFAFQSVSIVLQLALFFYLSRVVDNAKFDAHQNLNEGYFGYAAVGLALLTIVQVSLSSYSYKLREEQTTGTLEALMATPTSPSLIVLSSAVYDMIRATVTGLLLIAAAVVLFGLRLELDPASIGVATVALVGCLALFTSLGVAVAAFTIVFKRGTLLLALVVTGLALLGGVYFPIEVLPARSSGLPAPFRSPGVSMCSGRPCSGEPWTPRSWRGSSAPRCSCCPWPCWYSRLR